MLFVANFALPNADLNSEGYVYTLYSSFKKVVLMSSFFLHKNNNLSILLLSNLNNFVEAQVVLKNSWYVIE